jgi:hypothetical protein
MAFGGGRLGAGAGGVGGGTGSGSTGGTYIMSTRLAASVGLFDPLASSSVLRESATAAPMSNRCTNPLAVSGTQLRRTALPQIRMLKNSPASCHIDTCDGYEWT